MSSTKRSKSGGAQPLSRERVLERAVGLADRDGLAALSMRYLASELGVKAMSLYNHVANKEDLIDGMVDRVAGEIELPVPGGDWKAAMRRRATTARAVLLRHPWATMEFVSRINIGPAMLRYVDASIGCLVAAGFSYPLADHAWNAIDSHIYGYTLQEQNFPFEADEYAEVAKGYLAMIPEERYPYLNGMTREVIAGRHDGLHTLEFGLELLLDGLERMRDAEAAG